MLRFWSPDGTFPSQAFKAKFKIESLQFEHQGQGIELSSSSVKNNWEQTFVSNVNYPLPCPSNLRQKSTIVAPSGYNVKVILPVDEPLEEQVCETDYVEVSSEVSTSILLAKVSLPDSGD